MDVVVIFLIVVCFFLLPTIPAVLFYKLSPKAVVKEARTVAAYGPISVKLGGSAALYLAFFFLLNQTPLMNVLEDAITEKLTGQISLTGKIEFPLPKDVTDDQNKINQFIEGARDLLGNATVTFHPATVPVVNFEYPCTGGKAFGEITVTVPSSWAKQLRRETNARLTIQPSRTKTLAVLPIEIRKNAFSEKERLLGTDKITLEDVFVVRVALESDENTQREQERKSKEQEDTLSKPIDESGAQDAYKNQKETSLGA